MKKVSVQQLIEMPSGVIYSNTDSSELHEFDKKISGTTDFWHKILSCPSDICLMLDGIIGEDEVDDFKTEAETTERWGLFEDDAEFLVYDIEDLEYIKSRIENAIYVLKEQKVH